MEQFYFQYEWDPSLRRQARLEIQRQEYQQQIQFYRTRTNAQAFMVAIVVSFTFVVWLMADRLLSVSASAFYDSFFVLMYLVAVRLSARRLGLIDIIRASSSSKGHWSQWPTVLAIIFGPSLILFLLTDIVVPTSILFPLAITLHEVCALIWDWRQLHHQQAIIATKLESDSQYGI